MKATVKILSCVSVLALALTFAGCASSGAAESGEAERSTVETEVVEEAEAAPVEEVAE